VYVCRVGRSELGGAIVRCIVHRYTDAAFINRQRQQQQFNTTVTLLHSHRASEAHSSVHPRCVAMFHLSLCSMLLS